MSLVVIIVQIVVFVISAECAWFSALAVFLVSFCSFFC
jgi:hypothetical protein